MLMCMFIHMHGCRNNARVKRPKPLINARAVAEIVTAQTWRSELAIMGQNFYMSSYFGPLRPPPPTTGHAIQRMLNRKLAVVR